MLLVPSFLLLPTSAFPFLLSGICVTKLSQGTESLSWASTPSRSLPRARTKDVTMWAWASVVLTSGWWASRWTWRAQVRAAFGAYMVCADNLVLGEPPPWTRWFFCKDCVKSQPGSFSAAYIAEGSSQSSFGLLLMCHLCDTQVSCVTSSQRYEMRSPSGYLGVFIFLILVGIC